MGNPNFSLRYPDFVGPLATLKRTVPRCLYLTPSSLPSQVHQSNMINTDGENPQYVGYSLGPYV